MKDYLLLFRGGLNFQTAAPDQLQQTLGKWKDWIDMLTTDGRYGGGQRVTRTGKVLRGKSIVVTEGPYAEGEIVGGHITLKANSIDEAAEIAKGCPIFNFDGICEVREIAV